MSSEVATQKAQPSGREPATQGPKQSWWSELSRRDLGSLPVVLTLVIIAVFFQITSKGLFLSPRNLTYLTLQIATIGMLGLASVLVLLIAEIDLSLGAVAYVCGAITAVMSVNHGWNAVAALAAGVVSGALIGLVNGIFVAVLRVPSFIVTLAGLIGYQGLAIHVLFPQTTLIINDNTIQALATTYLPPVIGIGLPLVVVGLYVLGLFINRSRRQAAGLPMGPAREVLIQSAVAVVIVALAITLFTAYLGIPLSPAILIGFILVFWLIMRFTRFGRHIYATGGNLEASRRAGINVIGIRVVVFVLASTLAAVGGILLASRLDAGTSQVDQTLLLNAIAAAVIGGVSLFGGRGSVWAVVLGSLVIGSLSNGLDLLGGNTDVKFMIEGVVLLIAVTADALTRRRSATS